MADYQEYRRRILHRRWRRMFITAALLILLVLLAAVGVLWKRLHREPAPNTAQGPTILQQELTGSEWNTISYTPARRLSVQTLDNGMTAMDFRLAAQPASPAVERSSFSDVSFLGDSLTQGMQLYDTGLPNAHFCAYKGVGPNAVVNNTTCRRADGEKEVPMEALASQQPRALYILLGTNIRTRCRRCRTASGVRTSQKLQNPRRGCCRRTAPWGGAGRSSSPAPGRLRR